MKIGATTDAVLSPSADNPSRRIPDNELHWKRMMLLIVDDNAAMRRLIRRMTRDLAERIEECSDGAQALAAYERHRLGANDWVLMDIELPGLDGISATQQLCARHPEARVLIVTKYDDEELRRRSLACGACGFIHKDNLLELCAVLQPEH